MATPRHRWLGTGIRDWFYSVQRWLFGTAASTLLPYRMVVDAPVPSGPAIFTANHCSFLDPPLMGWPLCRPLSFVARDTLAGSRFLKWYLKRIGTILIRREMGKDGIAAAVETARQGGALMMYPEGTRSWNGWVQPFKPGARLIASRTGAVTIPTYGCGYYYAYPRFRKLPRPAPLLTMYGEPLEPPKAGDNGAAWDEELFRRVLALEERGRAFYRQVFRWTNWDRRDAELMDEARAYAARKGINLASQIQRGPGSAGS